MAFLLGGFCVAHSVEEASCSAVMADVSPRIFMFKINQYLLAREDWHKVECRYVKMVGLYK